MRQNIAIAASNLDTFSSLDSLDEAALYVQDNVLLFKQDDEAWQIAANIAKLPELLRQTLLWVRAVIPGVSAICPSVRLLGVRGSL